MPFDGNPSRMTKAWLRRRSDHELRELSAMYRHDTCRGIDIREETRRRKTEVADVCPACAEGRRYDEASCSR